MRFTILYSVKLKYFYIRVVALNEVYNFVVLSFHIWSR